MDGTFTISAKDISDFPVNAIPDQKYTGEEVKPEIVIEGLTEGVDFTVEYTNNVEAGTATVTIKGIGNYTGTITMNFEIIEEVIVEEKGIIQIYGPTRYQTSLGVAEEIKAIRGIDKFDAMIIATGKNFADALSGSYLAYVKDAPIILINDNYAADIVEYINENLVSGGKLYVLGGEAAVADELLEGLNAPYERLKGATRYETNIEILKEAGVTSEQLLVCTGKVFADSLSASAAKMPIFLVGGDTLRDTQKEYLESITSDSYCIIGGEAAVTEEMEAVMGAYGDVTRIKGATRYETSIAVAEAFVPNPEAAVVAYASNFPDGLCGGLLAIYNNAPIILSAEKKPAPATTYIAENGIEEGYVLGGDACFTDETIAQIYDIAIDDIVKKYMPEN